VTVKLINLILNLFQLLKEWNETELTASKLWIIICAIMIDDDDDDDDDNNDKSKIKILK
jgi:hypothetical protein